MMEHELMVLVMDHLRSRFYGKYRGLVKDNADSTGRGRLKVQVKSVCGEEAVWAMPCVPYAGDGVGFVALPEAETGVWVEFEGGDPSYPIWTGFFWASDEAPENADPQVKLWKTGKATLKLHDGDDTILAETSSGARVELGQDVVSEAGTAKHTVGATGVVSEQGSGKVEVLPGVVKVNNGSVVVV
jgi:uncharacterized protein involved in type VI secretion and phage assembly